MTSCGASATFFRTEALASWRVLKSEAIPNKSFDASGTSSRGVRNMSAGRQTLDNETLYGGTVLAQLPTTEEIGNRLDAVAKPEVGLISNSRATTV